MKNLSKVQHRESGACMRRCVGLPSSLVSRLSTVCRAEAKRRRAFTLVEMLVTLVLLSLIVLALMAVFNSTQNAFRAGLTETDILESGRLAMGLISDDLEGMTPSRGFGIGSGKINAYIFNNSPVNFYANTNSGYSPLIQSLTASSGRRTNVLESFFILGRGSVNGTPSFVGTGYTVMTNSSDGLYSLYRFSTNAPLTSTNLSALFHVYFYNFLASPTNYSHLMDGVVDLTVTPYDPNGFAMTNTYEYNSDGSTNINRNTLFFAQSVPGVVGFYMFSNAVPASVEVTLGVLENNTLQRAEGFLQGSPAQLNYLSNHVGQVHVFRKRIWIRNVDPTAYQ